MTQKMNEIQISTSISKFFWDRATPTCSGVTCGCFCVTRQTEQLPQSVGTRTAGDIQRPALRRSLPASGLAPAKVKVRLSVTVSLPTLLSLSSGAVILNQRQFAPPQGHFELTRLEERELLASRG